MKILFSDYDQTFYVNDIDIEKNKKAISKFRKNNNLFIFATGRSHVDFMNIVNKYQLEYDYVILNHGATILDKNDNVLFNNPIDSNIINNVVNDLDISNSINHFFCNIDNSRCSINDLNITKINVKYADKNKALEIKNIIDNKYHNYIHSYIVMSGALEIVNINVNKAVAINKLLDLLKVDTAEIYTIGDGYSDIEMIKQNDGYCMKDAIDELKKYCKNKQVDSVSELVDIIC